MGPRQIKIGEKHIEHIFVIMLASVYYTYVAPRHMLQRMVKRRNFHVVGASCGNQIYGHFAHWNI
ncbi:hypothetical protein BJI67_06955 [Acidihalobacter aeolianus]|uniref:Uncharacterized protein n=1 Tax=Acidihalobacter aeolianus TaxID=2792603 RepID=A0A1D8K7A6_9GAMM|nr:hypothetical protein BJI67_06955 [Acidihalobacter aeolianus]